MIGKITFRQNGKSLKSPVSINHQFNMKQANDEPLEDNPVYTSASSIRNPVISPTLSVKNKEKIPSDASSQSPPRPPSLAAPLPPPSPLPPPPSCPLRLSTSNPHSLAPIYRFVFLLFTLFPLPFNLLMLLSPNVYLWEALSQIYFGSSQACCVIYMCSRLMKRDMMVTEKCAFGCVCLQGNNDPRFRSRLISLLIKY